MKYRYEPCDGSERENKAETTTTRITRTPSSSAIYPPSFFSPTSRYYPKTSACCFHNVSTGRREKKTESQSSDEESTSHRKGFCSTHLDPVIVLQLHRRDGRLLIRVGGAAQTREIVGQSTGGRKVDAIACRRRVAYKIAEPFPGSLAGK